MNNKVLILGGTGHFGSYIAKSLAKIPNLEIVLSGRCYEKVEKFGMELTQQLKKENKIAENTYFTPVSIDIYGQYLNEKIKNCEAKILIHTAGPFQGQDYKVAEACLANGIHYLDLADGRDFVLDIAKYHEQAVKSKLHIISGVSTLPGISSTVIMHLKPLLKNMEEIQITIAPSHQTPRGESTVEAVLSYCGKPFEVLKKGKWVTLYGWQDLTLRNYDKLGLRLSGICNVPDLSLIPLMFPEVKTATFHASLESWVEHISLSLMGTWVKLGLLKSWSDHSDFFTKLSQKLLRLGGKTGGMQVSIIGKNEKDTPIKITWDLVTYNNIGPIIPCVPAIILTQKILNHEIQEYGARACWNMFSLSDFTKEIKDLDIEWEINDETTLNPKLIDSSR